MLNLHPLECTIKDNDHIPDLLLIKYWGIISCKYTYLNKGLKRLKKVCESRGIKTVSLPKIGAGLGTLDWNSEVKPLLESILSDCETVFNVYEDYKIEYEI